MRLLFLIPQLSGGGAERQLGYLMAQLANSGHDVHAAYTEDGPDTPLLENVTLHRIPSRSNYDPWVLWLLGRLVRSLKPDLIQTGLLKMDILGGLAARALGVPWVVRESSSAIAYGPTLKNQLRVRLASGASAIISNSRGGHDFWRKKLPDQRLQIVPNGLPLDDLAEVRGAVPFETMRSGFPIVLFAGRLASDRTAVKNIPAFLESFALFRRQFSAQGVVCGAGPQQAELEAIRHRLGLDSDVIFTGNLPAASVWALMKRASIFMSLSAYEGCPNTVLEAMACGCPLVVSDIPAHRELLDEHSALFVDPSDIRQAADAIARVIFDEKASASRRDVALAKAKELSVEKMAARYERIYRQIIKDVANL